MAFGKLAKDKQGINRKDRKPPKNKKALEISDVDCYHPKCKKKVPQIAVEFDHIADEPGPFCSVECCRDYFNVPFTSSSASTVRRSNTSLYHRKKKH